MAPPPRPDLYPGLHARIPGLHLNRAGGACPFQADGALHGLPLYFRYRHGTASLTLGEDLMKPLYLASTGYGDDLQGILTKTEFEDLMLVLVADLAKAPILWEFLGVSVYDTRSLPAGSPTTYGAWGATPAEAWETMHQPIAFLTEKGYTDEAQADLLAARQMKPHTITVDDRSFPNPEPQFVVLPPTQP